MNANNACTSGHIIRFMFLGLQARENACERGTIGFGFVSHWLRKQREFC